MNPKVQIGDGGFGVLSNQCGFTITGTTNIPIVVEACTNLGNQAGPLCKPAPHQRLNLFQRSAVDELSRPFLPHSLTLKWRLLASFHRLHICRVAPARPVPTFWKTDSLEGVTSGGDADDALRYLVVTTARTVVLQKLRGV